MIPFGPCPNTIPSGPQLIPKGLSAWQIVTAAPPREFGIRIVRGGNADHAERLERPRCHLVGGVLERRQQAEDLHVYAEWQRQCDRQRQ